MRPPREYGPVWIVAELLAWLLFPVGLLWMLFDRGSRWAARTPQERVDRMLRWYPPDWRARYGDEFAALLHDATADGRDGLRLWHDVAREALAARLKAATGDRRTWIGALLWTAGIVATLPLGIVPLVLSGDGRVLEIPPAVTIAAGLVLVAASLRVFTLRTA